MSRRRLLIVAILASAVTAATAVYLYRDGIARRAANSVLAGTGLTIASLSIDEIGSRSVSFDELVVAQDSGTEFVLRGISLPLSWRGGGTANLSIESAEILIGGESEGGTDLGAILGIMIDLPAMIPYSDVIIGTLEYQPYLRLRDVMWRSENGGQLLQLLVDDFSLTAAIVPDAVQAYRLTMTASKPDFDNALALALSLRPDTNGWQLEGQATATMPALLPVMRDLNMIPDGLLDIDTILRGSVKTNVPRGMSAEFDIQATLQADSALNLRYEIEEGKPYVLRSEALDVLQSKIHYPTFEWHTTLASGELLLSVPALGLLPLGLENLRCQRGITCTAITRITDATVTNGIHRITGLSVAAPIETTIDSDLHVLVGSALEVTAAGLETDGFAAKRLVLREFDHARIHVSDDGWRLSAPATLLEVYEVTSAIGIEGTAPIRIGRLLIEQSGDTVSFDWDAPGAGMRWDYGDYSVELPDMRGSASVERNLLSVDGALAYDEDALLGAFVAQLDLAKGTGHFELRELALDFAKRPLSKLVTLPEGAPDIVSGRVHMTAEIDQARSEPSSTWHGKVDVDIADIAGNRGDIVFTGARTALSLRKDAGGTLAPLQAQVHVDLVDVGVPIANVTVDATIDPSALRAAVHSAEADVLGGRVSADPFQYDPASDHLIVGVNLKSIQLPLILSMADFESIEIDGQVSGHIPVELKDDKLTISGGKISADQPGGSIRYQGGDGNMGNASLGVASAALSNFVFDSLTSNVAYDDVGNLVLAMRMEGTNPDLDPLQPVILNLNVENNIPQLLRSLQATRSIQEILERKAGIER